VATLVLGCAGELDKDPNSFNFAFAPANGTGGTPSGTGGSTGTGGTMGATGGSATGGTVGTGGSGTGGTAMAPPDDPCVATVFSSQTCTVCHSTAAAASIGAGLILEGTNLGARLMTTKATYKGASNMAACVPGALIIDPDVPANSILLKKVAGTQACGDKMPAGTGLSGTNLQCIQDWIAKF
jgi:hypothetical protein